ncbi:MAG: hypothetical protein R2880_08270 [Deinococcales bacterium]
MLEPQLQHHHPTPSPTLDKTDNSTNPQQNAILRAGISHFSSNISLLRGSQSFNLDFSTHQADELWLDVGSQHIRLSNPTTYQLQLNQASHLSLRAVKAHQVVSTSLSLPQTGQDAQGDYYYLPLTQAEIARLRPLNQDKEHRFKLEINHLNPQEELVLIAINDLNASQAQKVQLSYQGELQPAQDLSTSAHPNSLERTGQFDPDHLDLSSASLSQQTFESCEAQGIGDRCYFSLAVWNAASQNYQEQRHAFKLSHIKDGIRFFVDEADGRSLPLNAYGICASEAFQIFQGLIQESYDDADQSQGVSLVFSSSLAHNGLVRWGDLVKQADIAYLNSNYMKDVTALSLATLYEEIFHVYHLGYRAKKGLSQPDRFEAESLIGAVLAELKMSESLSRACGGLGSSLELATASLSLADLFLMNPHQRNFLNTQGGNDMFEYGLGRLLTSIMNYRQGDFIQRIIKANETASAAWANNTDMTRIIEDAFLSLVLNNNSDFKGYHLSQDLYKKRDVGYDLHQQLARNSSFSLTDTSQIDNQSLLILSAKGTGEAVTLDISFDQGSILAFIRR